MKKEILDELTRDSFSDFLEKGETILWTKTLEEKIEIPLILNDEGQISFHFKQCRWYFIYLLFMSILLLFLFGQYEENYWFLPVVPFIFGIIGIPRIFKIYGKRIHKTMYAITQKQILFRLSQLPKNEIHHIYFSQIKTFITLANKINGMTFIFSIKNPESIPFVTYAIDSDEQRHQPTLENIKDLDEVTQLIRQGIQQNN